VTSNSFETEVRSGERFTFGKNWRNFLTHLTSEQIEVAAQSLTVDAGENGLNGKRFLDIGSGSGLFSLAAMQSGATHVHSFDFDPDSVACALYLREKYGVDPAIWTIEQGSALDAAYMSRLGQWDFVYSWGVLHHTGNMWAAMERVAPLVKPGGTLFIAVYHDQGGASTRWLEIKRAYNRNTLSKWVVAPGVILYFVSRSGLINLLRGRNPLNMFRNYRSDRGMSQFRDWIDWIGGYPFEVAKPEQVFQFFRDRGFVLIRLKTSRGGLGCNEFVFCKL
jgi:2-polyprenyl-3-methyl-5-hydroxy-6-metoxy-1,4-benzoquinol methylase